MGRIADQVLEMAEPIVEQSGLELVDVEYQKEGEQYVLRVFIERPGGGVDLDDCQEVSRKLSERLDIEDPIDSSYILEVSSPGIDRPLRKDSDFERFAGRNIDISGYRPLYKKEKKLTAELVGLKDDNVIVIIDDEEVEIPRDSISSIRLAVEFE